MQETPKLTLFVKSVPKENTSSSPLSSSLVDIWKSKTSFPKAPTDFKNNLKSSSFKSAVTSYWGIWSSTAELSNQNPTSNPGDARL